MNNLAIEIRQLSKRYGDRQALSAVDLAVPEGSFFAVLGPNGAGKTTLLRCLMGMLRPDTGTGHVLGAPLGPGYPPLAVKARMGYVAQQPALYGHMTAPELIAMCKGLYPTWDDALVARYRTLFQLPLDRPVRQMSAGTRAQLALTLVMGGSPDLLVLDEPTLGLDPLNRHQYLQVLVEESMEAGRTVILSSHDLHQIERLADRVLILRQGAPAVAGAVDDLKLEEKRVRVAGEVAEQAVLAVPCVRRAVRERTGWLVFARGEGGALREALLALPGVVGVQVFDQSLEEIFLSYVS